MEINPAAVTTFAGNGTNATVDGVGTQASFRDMGGVVVVGAFAYVGTRGSIRKVDLSTAQVTTLAGSANDYGCTDSSNPNSVRFQEIYGMATDGTNLYAISCGKVRKTVISSGATSTLSTVTNAFGVSYASDGFLYVTDQIAKTVVKVDPSNGSTSTFATLTGNPEAITSDATSLWVAQYSPNRIEQIPVPGGTITTFASPADLSRGAIESAGAYIYVTAGNGTNALLRRYTKSDASWVDIAGTGVSGYADGTGTDAWFAWIRGLVSDGTSLWISDYTNYRLRKAVATTPLPAAQSSSANTTVAINPAAITTFAGSGTNATVDGVGTGASFRDMGGAVVVDGFAYVVTRGSIRKVNLATAQVTTLAGHANNFGCIDSPNPTAVRIDYVSGLTTDGTYLYTLTTCGSTPRLRRVSIATGATSTVASISGLPVGGTNDSDLTFGPDGYIYVTTVGPKTVLKVDRITGVTSTLATLAGNTYAITSDSTDLWVAVYVSSSDWRIQRVALPGGTVATLASSPDLSMYAIESTGSYLYVTAGAGSLVRRYAKADASWVNVAGTSTAGYADGTGTDAWFGAIQGIASDGTNLWLADSSNYRLRKAVATTPLPAGQTPTAVSTLALDNPAVVGTFAGNAVNDSKDWAYSNASFRTMGGAAVVGRYVYIGTQGSIRKIDLATGETGGVGVYSWVDFFSVTCKSHSDFLQVKFRYLTDIVSDGHYLYTAGECGNNFPMRIARTDIVSGATSTVAEITNANRITFGPDGYIYVTTGTQRTVLKMDRITGVTSTFATLAGDSHAITSDAQNLYVVIQLTGGERRIERIAVPAGTVSTFSTAPAMGLGALESAGDYLYEAIGTGNTAIRRHEKATGTYVDIVGSVAGGGYIDGSGSDARFGNIQGIASDGNLLWIADSSNYVVRVVSDKSFQASGQSSFGWDGYGGWWGGVNAPLGNFVSSMTDVLVNTTGPELAVTRTYNSLDPRIGAFGRGWTFNYEMRWEPVGVGGNVAILYPDGRREVHTKNLDGSFIAPLGYFSTVTSDGNGGYTVTTKDRTVFALSSQKRLTSITDANGHRVDFAYGGDGKLTTATAVPGGRTLTFTWTGDRITLVSTQTVAAHGGPLTWKFYYDPLFPEKLTKACDPRNNLETGICTVYEYSGRLINLVKKPKGNTEVEVGYLPSGVVDWRADGMANLTNVDYPTNAKVTVLDARGYTTTQEFDTKFRLSKETDPLIKVTTYEYDSKGNRKKIIDPNLNNHQVEFDSKGNMTSSTDPEGKTTYLAYDASNNLTALRDPRSSGPTDNTYRTQYEYDSSGNRTRETTPPTSVFPSGTVKSWTYTTGTEPAIGGGTMPAGLLRTATDERNKVTTYSYDAKGDLRELLDPVGLRTAYTYDEIGRRLTSAVYSDSYPDGVATAYTYNQLGDVLTETGPTVANVVSGVSHRQKVTNIYDNNRNLERTTLEDLVGGDASRVTEYAYDASDRLVTIKDPENGILSREFDANGNVKKVTDQAGRVTEITYDQRNLPTTATLKDFVDDPIEGSTPRDVVLKAFTYDSAARKLTEVDAEGRTTQWGHDKADRVLIVKLLNYHNRDASTRDVVLEDNAYDAAGNLLTQIVGGGKRKVVHGYDQAGRRITSTLDPQGLNRLTTYTYDAATNVTAVTTSDATRTEEVRFAYDDANRPTSKTVENGATDLVTTYTYDQRGTTLSEVDPRGNQQGADPAAFTTSYAYDELGRLVSSTAPPVSVEEEGGTPSTARPLTQFGYNTFGDLTHRKNPRAFTTQFLFDRLSRRTQVTHPTYAKPDGGTVQATELFGYDPVGNLLAYTDRRQKTTDFTFDKMNRVVQQLDPLVTGEGGRGSIRYQYDDVSNRTALIDQRGARTEWTYDDLNRVRTNVAVVRIQGQPDARYTTTFDYDDLGNQAYLEDPVGNTTQSEYNAASELTQRTDPRGKNWTWTYDLGSRLASAVDPLNRKVTQTHDLAGRLTQTKDFDRNDLLLITSNFGYDAAGNRTTLTPPRGYSSTFTYDAMNRLTGVTQPVTESTSITTSYGYDLAGNNTRVTNGNAKVTVLTYNAWDLLEEVIEPSTIAHPALTDRTFTTTYDAGGLPVTEAQPGGVTVSRTYDQLGRLTSESGSGGGAPSATRTMGYDLAGLLTSAGHPSGTITFAYDDRKLLTGTAGPAGTSSFEYDAAGRMTSRTDPAGTASFTWTSRNELNTATDPLTGITANHTWDDAGQLTEIKYGGGSLPKRTLSWDDLSRLTSDALTDTSSTTTASHTYGYDDDSNVTSQTITLPGNSSAGQHTYQYDRSGRITKWTRPDASFTDYAWDGTGNRTQAGASTYTYDERNRLISGPEGTYTWTARGTLSQVGSTTLSFDALGRLGDYNGSVAYAYDSLDRIATRSAQPFTYAGRELDPVTEGAFTYARSPAGRLLAVKKNSTSSLAGLTRHGDLAYLFSSTGAVSDTRVYDPFGNQLAETGTTDPNLGFQADYTDPTSFRVWMGARWYGPTTGAFLSRDGVAGLLSTPVSLNRYTYAFADPLEFADPDGQWSFGGFLSSLWRGLTGGVTSMLRWGSTSTSTLVASSTSQVSPYYATAQTRYTQAVGVQAARGQYGPALSSEWKAMSWVEKNHHFIQMAGPGAIEPDFYYQGRQRAAGAIRFLTAPLNVVNPWHWAKVKREGGWMGVLDEVNQNFNPAYLAMNSGRAAVSHLNEGRFGMAALDLALGTAGVAVTGGIAHKALRGIESANTFVGRWLGRGRQSEVQGLPDELITSQFAAGERAMARRSRSSGPTPRVTDEASTASGQVGYGSTDLSRIAIAARRQGGIMGTRNTAVFEYGTNSTLRTATGFSQRGVGHAERLVWRDLEAAGVEPSHVTRIYSELQPCALPGGYCSNWITNTFPNASVTWSFEYGVSAASRASGVRALKEAIAGL